jgi:hypothetical protein
MLHNARQVSRIGVVVKNAICSATHWLFPRLPGIGTRGLASLNGYNAYAASGGPQDAFLKADPHAGRPKLPQGGSFLDHALPATGPVSSR